MIDVAHPATYADGVPHAEFRRLREAGNVSWVPEPALIRHSSAGQTAVRGTGYWAVVGHPEVVEVARLPEAYSSAAKGAFLVDPRTKADLRTARQLLVNMDAPEHARIRKLVTSVFTPKAIGGLADSVRGHAANLVEKVVAAPEFDVVTDFAAELPLLVLTDLLGMPKEDRHLLYRWGNQLVGFDDPEYGGGDVEAYRRTFVEAFQYALGKRAEAVRSPRDDLMSKLANAELDGHPLADREFCQFWLLLVVAGNETTRHLLAGSIRALADHPAQRDALAADPSMLPTAVEELLRWVTPIMQFRRTATRDLVLGGRKIAAGDKVVLYYTSANRDERVFTDPDRLDLARAVNPHLAFGIGPHFCLGTHLARLEATAALSGLAPHLHRLRIAEPVVRMESNFVNGIKSLPARWLAG
ncbi:cytochrome P450 [Amycolatopsis minnesotensis]|uniref:Cytochrome P450 n=1 Tax=Amycolatopsis minnesotensis TaxID=337894 RepID=A0ABP5BXR4_9PSEU